MPVAHTPNADPATYRAHFDSAIREWVRTGIIDLEELIRHVEFGHPSPEDLKAASEGSQDGSVAYNLNTGDGTIAVAPAIPHTEETVRAAEAAGTTLPPAAYETAGVEPRATGTGSAAPATTSTATAGSADLADTSTRPEATPDNPEGTGGTGVLNEEEAEPGLLSPDEAAALQTDQTV